MIFEYFLGFTIVGCVVFLFYHILIYTQTKVPIISTPKKCLKNLMGEIEVDEESVIYELGSGNGDFAFAVAKLNPKRVVGYELSPLHVAYCRLKAKLTGSGAEFFTKDFFKEDLSEVDLIYLFLVPKISTKLWKKIESECKPGTLVILHGSKIIDVEPERSILADGGDSNSPKFHFYRV